MTGELLGAAAGAILATGVATYAGVRLHRQMPIVTWRAWVAGFPVKPVAWVLATAATLTLAATSIVALVTTVSKGHPAAESFGDHPTPLAVPGTASDPPRSRLTSSASPAASATSVAPEPPSPLRSHNPSRAPSPRQDPSPQSPSQTAVPSLSPTPTRSPSPSRTASPSPSLTPTPTPTPTGYSSPTPTPTPTGYSSPTASPSPSPSPTTTGYATGTPSPAVTPSP